MSRTLEQGPGRTERRCRGTLNEPRSVRVRTNAFGVPLEVNGHAVELVRESWIIEDRWWTARPLRRRYWEVLSASGRNMVVFHDLARRSGDGAGCSGDGWFAQRP
jgi:hypothetical protein